MKYLILILLVALLLVITGCANSPILINPTPEGVWLRGDFNAKIYRGGELVFEKKSNSVFIPSYYVGEDYTMEVWK